MAVAYVDEFGASICASQGLLIIEDKDGKQVASIRVQELESLVIQENCSITSAAIGLLLRNGVSAAFISHGGEFLGTLQPPMGRNILLRKQQYRLSDDLEFTLAIAKAIAAGKLTNMRAILLRYARTGERNLADDGCDLIQNMIDGTDSATSSDEVLGLEGTGSRAYFDAFPCIIKDPFSFTDRNRRPPQDPVNAMLGFAYALLENCMEAAVSSAGFDPYCGLYHKDHYGRESLALDLMEEMRPVIADSVVISICSRRMLDPIDDFENRDGGVFLNETGRQKFFRIFNARMNETIKPSADEPAITYERLCGRQARILAGCVNGKTPIYAPFLVK